MHKSTPYTGLFHLHLISTEVFDTLIQGALEELLHHIHLLLPHPLRIIC